MNPRDFAERIKALRPARVYVACTGAGAGLQEILWSVPGASSFLVGASFPYSKEATTDFLGFEPEHYCSVETAIDLAMASFLRAGAGSDAIGIGLTAKVASTAPHRGAHSIHAAFFSATATRTHSVEIPNGSGREQRLRDGTRADHVGLDAIADCMGMELFTSQIGAEKSLISDASGVSRERFFAHPWFRSGGARDPMPASLALAFPGTFDPPHAGHFGIVAATEAVAGTAPTFWITAEPPHKPAVPIATLLRRARLLRGHDVLFTKSDPLYVDKARLYPGCHFVVGADAFQSMLDPKWGLEIGPMLDEFRRLGTHFYVASRASAGKLVTLCNIREAPLDSCTELPGQWNVSSTELRLGGASDPGG